MTGQSRSARDEILARIRTATAGVSAPGTAIPAG